MRIALRTVASALIGLAGFALLLFWPAGTLDYWQAWLFLAVFTAATLLPSIYLARRHPDVLQRRMRAGPTAETRPVQKAAVTGAFLMVTAVLVVSAFDHRFGWSQVPGTVTVIGAVLVATGLLISQFAVIQNAYAASNITVEAGQTVVTNGLYGMARHPLYFGAVVMMIGVPPALGSYWGFAALLPGPLILAYRILDEEALLVDELAGYRDYMNRVRYRLIPFVW